MSTARAINKDENKTQGAVEQDGGRCLRWVFSCSCYLCSVTVLDSAVVATDFYLYCEGVT